MRTRRRIELIRNNMKSTLILIVAIQLLITVLLGIVMYDYTTGAKRASMCVERMQKVPGTQTKRRQQPLSPTPDLRQ